MSKLSQCRLTNLSTIASKKRRIAGLFSRNSRPHQNKDKVIILDSGEGLGPTPFKTQFINQEILFFNNRDFAIGTSEKHSRLNIGLE